MARSVPGFGELIREIIGARSIRQAAKVAELHHTTLMQMADDRPTSARTIAQFATKLRATAWQRARLFAMAGLVDPDGPGESGAEILLRGIFELSRQRPVNISLTVPPDQLTPELAREILQNIESSWGDHEERPTD